jgi:hypothetical protein
MPGFSAVTAISQCANTACCYCVYSCPGAGRQSCDALLCAVWSHRYVSHVMHSLVLYGHPVCPVLQPDVLCLQEVDHWKQVRDELQDMG